MPCRYANIIRMPVIEEVTETEVGVFDPKSGKRYTHYEQLLVPSYKVSWLYDFGFCCGVDFHSEEFATREEAQAVIDKVLANEHDWLTYDPELIEDED